MVAHVEYFNAELMKEYLKLDQIKLELRASNLLKIARPAFPIFSTLRPKISTILKNGSEQLHSQRLDYDNLKQLLQLVCRDLYTLERQYEQNTSNLYTLERQREQNASNVYKEQCNIRSAIDATSNYIDASLKFFKTHLAEKLTSVDFEAVLKLLDGEFCREFNMTSFKFSFQSFDVFKLRLFVNKFNVCVVGMLAYIDS